MSAPYKNDRTPAVIAWRRADFPNASPTWKDAKGCPVGQGGGKSRDEGVRPERYVSLAQVCQSEGGVMSPPRHADKLPGGSEEWYRRFERELFRHVLIARINALVTRFETRDCSRPPRVVSEEEP